MMLLLFIQSVSFIYPHTNMTTMPSLKGNTSFYFSLESFVEVIIASLVPSFLRLAPPMIIISKSP